MPRVTVTLGSSRPGGIDIALAGLCAQTFEDFEVVFVDALYHSRHEQVLDAVKRSGLKQPFYHVPNHRYSGTIWGTNCAGYNTGFALADGEIVVMLLDYAFAPPNWLEHHVAHAGKLVLAPHEYRTLTNPVSTCEDLVRFDRTLVDCVAAEAAIDMIQRQRAGFDMISCFAKPFCAADLDVYPVEHVSIPGTQKNGKSEPYWFSTKNESFPLNNVFLCNGMDERYDRGRGPGDPDLGYRLSWTKLEPWVCREAIVHCINPRPYLPNMNIVIPEVGKLEGYERMTTDEGSALYEATRNEMAVRPPNPISLLELRERIWSWRELSQKRDPVIPMNVVPDAEYWAKLEAA